MRLLRQVIAGLVLLIVQPVLAAPVIPGATGFGIETPAGRGGQIVRVTNLDNSGSGSLRACVEASGPRTCIFEVAGNIYLSNPIKIENPRLTIAGQTAPDPGITILGAYIRISASDVLMQHIAIRPGDGPVGGSPGTRDALKIGGNESLGIARNIVIDHCSFSWSIDELSSTLSNYADNVTIRNSIFAFPLDDSIHPQTSPQGDGNGHGLGFLVNDGPGRVDMSNNLFAHIRARNPMSRVANFVFRNNIVYNFRRVGTQFISKGRNTNNDVVSNVYIAGSDTGTRAPVLIGENSTNTLPNGSRVFEDGNIYVRSNGTVTTNVLENYSSGSVVVNSANFPILSSQVAPANPDSFVEEMLADVGRRPAKRASGDVDTRAVNETINRTGSAINCVEDDGSAVCDANAGGWPEQSQARAPLTTPTNPNGDDDGDGYTNLEEWLHTLASEVESGNPSAGPPPQAASVPMPPTFN